MESDTFKGKLMYNDALEKFDRYDKRVTKTQTYYDIFQKFFLKFIKNRMFDYVNALKQKYINVSRYSK